MLLEDVSARLVALRHARAAFASRLAPEFNVFDFIERSELKLSKILAWLFDPSGSHAQGSRFLEEYVRLFAPELDQRWCNEVVVRLEANCGNQRRIDILVETPSCAIAIENKPYAGDQNEQLSCYLKYLSKYEKGRLIYLAGTADRLPGENSLGEDDRTKSVKDGRLLLTSYAELIPWVTACRGRCECERIRVFLDDFQQFILAEFEGVKDMTEHAMLVEQIVRDPQRIDAASKIASSWRDAQVDLIGKLDLQMRKLAPPGWIFDGELDHKRYATLTISAPAVAPAMVGFQFEQRSYNAFCYGVLRPKARKAQLEQIKASLDASIGHGAKEAPTELWSWWRQTTPQDVLLPLPANWEHVSDPWQQIADGTLAVRLVKTVEQIFNVIERQEGVSGQS